MSYNRTGNRVSLLPISEFCGLAAKLSSGLGAGRAAAKSKAWHARAAGAPEAAQVAAMLTPDELNEIAGWPLPTPVQVCGHELTYEAADKEQPIGLTDTGEWADDGEVLTCGTLDFAWIVEHPDPFVGRVAVVADLKKSRWTVSRPDTLQLLTYGYAWAKKHGCRAFMVGLWIIEDAEWVWAPTVFELDSFTELDLWQRIQFAARNMSGEASLGEHCDSCYSKLHCPDWVLPAAMADTVLAAFAEGATPTGEQIAAGLAYAQATKKVIERVEELAKEHSKRGERLIHPITGKVFKGSPTKGRESLNQAKLFAAIPDATRFVERGNPYLTFRWIKP